MGLILDTSALVAGERRGENVGQVLRRVQAARGEIETALSAINVVELTHGIYGAKTDVDRERWRVFAESGTAT